jgi:type IV pilus assembly protein PilE
VQTRHWNPPRPFAGFTLIEAVLVVALLGILATLSFPSYQAFLLRAHRSDAVGRLMEIAACQEQVRATVGAYDETQCLPPADARYRFEYRSAGGAGDYFQVAAQPQGAQAADRCGALLLDSAGARSVEASAPDAGRCWSGR